MIKRPRRVRGKNNYPDVTLRCDWKGCTEEQTFAYGTEYHAITHWAKAHGWRLTYKGAGVFMHHCRFCERLTVAPQSYYDRVVNG